MSKQEENNVVMERRKEFQELCEPLMNWLHVNHHPHMTIIIDSALAQLVEGQMTCRNERLIRIQGPEPFEPIGLKKMTVPNTFKT